ncbi:unnamed protein product [Urochloa humidicola]
MATPPPPPPPPPSALMDEIIEEFLLRVPPDDPASLVRAALVCKPWCRLVSCPRFRRRYRERHRTPPLLGFVEFVHGFDSDCLSRFVSTSSFRPPRAELRGWVAIHTCHGRVLCTLPPWGDEPEQNRLIVWDLMTGEQRELPRLPWCSYPRARWNSAILCASSVGVGCNYLDCHRAPFLVAFVGTTYGRTVAHVYSSETDAWGEATFAQDNGYEQLCLFTGALVGNALYFCKLGRTKLLKYDMTTREISVINLPAQAPQAADCDRGHGGW